MKFLSGASVFLQYTFLIQFLFKIDESPLWRLPPPVHISYTILITYYPSDEKVGLGGGATI
jgi:hypothetical protein